MTIHDSKKSAVSRRWTAALLAAAAAAGLTGAVSAAGPQQEDELWWLTGGSGEHSQADPAAKNPVQLSAPGGDEETPADPEGPGEAYDGPSTVHNEEGFFVKQEDETGHGTWNSLTEKGLWVGGDGDDTGFRVDNDGNVATTGNADIDGTLSASNDKFTVDEKGNLHAKNENARIDLDEAGAYLQSNTTYIGVTDGTATIASGASRVQVTEDGAVFETPDGKTSIKGNAVETGKVTAEKGDIGGVWMADRNVSNVDKITAEKGDIGNVYLKDGTISAAGGQFTVDETGKVTASKGDVVGVWMADRNVSNVDKITAEKGDIGDVYLKDGTITAEKGDIGDVYLKDRTITVAGGQFTVDETGKVTAEKGDIGDVWMADGKLSADFIQNKNGSFMADGDGNVKMNDATAAGDLDVAGTLTAGGGNFAVHEDGLVDTKTGIVVNDGNFAVHSDGLMETRNGINAANGNFLVYDTGLIQTASGINAANGNFLVYDTGDTEVKGNVEAETFSTAGGAFKVGNDGSVTAEGQSAVGGVHLNEGRISAADGDFRVDDGGALKAAGGAFTVDENGNVNIGGKVTADRGVIGDVTLNDGKVTADRGVIGDVTLNDGKVTADRGVIGDVTLNDGKVTADRGVIGDVTLNDGKVAADRGVIGDVTLNDGKVTADRGVIGDVTLNDGKVTADCGVIGDVTLNDGKVTADRGIIGDVTLNDGKVTADRGVIGEVTLNDGKVTAQDGDFSGSVTAETGTIGGVAMADGTITAAGGQFTVDETGKVTAEKGDVGDVWMADGNVTAASIQNRDGSFKADADGNVTAASGAFSGSVTAENGTIGGVTMTGGGIIAADDNFVVNGETGAFRAAGNKFHVYGSGDVTADGTLTAGAVKTDSGADLDEVAANLGTLDDAAVKWDDADKNSVNGVTLDNGGITAEGRSVVGGVTMTDGGISAANNQFYVNGETGAFYAANQKFHVSGDGAVTAASVTAGTVATTGGADLDTVADELKTLNGTAVKAGEDGSINGVFLNDGKIGTVNGNFHVDKNGSITAAGAGTIGGVSLSNGAVAAQDVTITLAANGREAETVSMSDMWDAMSGGTMTVGGISYGGSYFYTSGTNTPHLSIGGGRYDVNMNHFGQIMDAVEGVGVDTVTDAIDGLKKDEAGSGTASGTSAAGNEAVTASANGAEAAPAAKEARAKLAAASYSMAPDVTPSLLSEETEGSGQTGTDADPDREPPMTAEGGSGTEGGNAGQTLDLPNDHGSLGGLTITGNRPDENGNSFAVTGKSQFDGDSQFNGDVAIGNSDTDYSLKLNGEDVATENYVDHQITNAIGNRFDELGSEIDSVGAISAALAGLHPLDYDGTGSKFQLSAAVGSYDGTQAAAVGGFYHFNEDVMMSVGGATAFEGDHKTAANIGVTFRVGQGSSGKRLSSDAVMAQLEEMNRKIQAMDEKINSLEQKNQDLEAENKELKAEA